MRNLIVVLLLMPILVFAKAKESNERDVLLMRVTIPAKATETIEFSSQAGGKKMVQYYLDGAPITKKVELSQRSWKKWVEIRNKANKKEGHLIKELPQCQYQLWVEAKPTNSAKEKMKKETWCLPKKSKKLTDSFYSAFREVQALIKL